MKKIIALCMALMLLLTTGTVLAEEQTSEKDILDRLRIVQDFKFLNHKDGIGTDVAPVYTAPSSDAFRCAGGRARYELNGEISESNYVGDWLLIRYRIGNKDDKNAYDRVGYIHKKYVKGFKSLMPRLDFEHIPLTAAQDIDITDDPALKGTPFGTIHKGETFYVLMKYTYTGNWYYVECVIDGKTARGFIDRTKITFYLGEAVNPESDAKVYDLASVGYPEVSPRGTTARGHVEVNCKRRIGVKNEPDVNGTQISVVYPGKYYPCYDIVPTGWRNNQEWYYVWVEEDSEWGWIISSNEAMLVEE